MANDIDIRVKVANQTGSGFAAVNASLARLRQRADSGTQSLARLRAAAGTIASRATLDDDTSAGVAAVRTSLAQLRADSPVRLAVQFDGQSGQIVAAAQAMRDLRGDARGAGESLGRLTTRAAAAAAALQLVESAADGASRSLRTLRGRAQAAAEALGDVRTHARAAGTALRTLTTRADGANTRLGELGGSTRSLRGDLSDLDDVARRAGAGLAGLRGRLGTLSAGAGGASTSTRGLVEALVGLASAAIPVAAALVPIAAGAGAAGVALGAFGGAVAGQFVALGNLADAQDKASTAMGKHGVASAEAAAAQSEYLNELGEMPGATQEAAAALAVLKSEYQSWSNALAKDTMPVVIKSFAVFGALLPKLTPMVRSTSTELDRLVSVAAGGIQMPGFDRLVRQFSDFSSGVISKATTSLAGFAATADTGEIGANYREFMRYVRENGPLVGDTLSELGTAAVRLVVGFSDLGVSALTVVNALAGLVNAIPSGALSTMVQMYASVRLLQAGMAGLAAVLGSGLIGRLGAFVAAIAAGGVRSAVSGLAQGMTALQKAALGLGVLAVAAVGISKLAEKSRGAPPDVDRLTTSLKNLGEAGRFTGELRKTFGDIDGLVEKMKRFGEETQKMKDAQGGGTGWRIPGLDDLSESISGAVQDMVKGSNSFNALKDDFKGLDQALAGLASGGHADSAAASFARIKAAAREQGISVKELNQLFPEYKNSVAALKAEQDLVAAGMGLFGEQALKTKDHLDAQKQSADGLRQAIVALNETNRAGLGGMIGFEAAIDAATKAAKENAGALSMVDGKLDLNSSKSRDAATALQDLAAKTDEAASAARDSGQSWEQVNGIYDRGRTKLIAAAEQMGLTRGEARKLASQILKTPDKTARLRGNLDDLESAVAKAKRRIKSVPASKRSDLKGRLSDLQAKVAAAKRQLKSVPASKRSDMRGRIAQLQAAVRAAKRELASVPSSRTVYLNTVRRGYSMSGGSMNVGRPKATGGIVGAAGGGPRSSMTLVGEQGPELVDLPYGSTVIPNGQSRNMLSAAAMASGGSGGTTVLELRSSGSRMDDMLLEILRGAISVRGGDPNVVLRTRRRGQR